jgi:hypothetical protein
MGFVSVLFAEEPNYKNSLGWKSGLFYRRNITEHYWVGLNIGGKYNASKGSSSSTDQRVYPDSTTSRSAHYGDTSLNYSGTIKIEFGREVCAYKKLHIDLLVSGGYERIKYRSVNSRYNIDPYINDNPSHSILAIIAAEPKIRLWERLSLGTQMGVEYSYTFNKYNSSDGYQDDYNHITQTYVRESSSTSHSIELFGNFSLTSSLFLQFLF